MRIIESATEVEIAWILTGIIISYEEVKVKTPTGMIINKLLLKVASGNIGEDFYISRTDEGIDEYINKKICLIVTTSKVAGFREVVKINHLD
ncbi:hypothetical protein ABEH22_08170 [Pantoea agglomerans]|uniref:hypothetical protein n=1 Tax=Enterobacter agglomerans TaxID=549 RepID=UPI0032096965